MKDSTASTSTLAAVPATTNGHGHAHAPPAYTADLPSLDALPYFDREIETQPGLAALVKRELEAEMRKMDKEGKGKGKDGVAEGRLPAQVDVFEDHPEYSEAIARVGSGSSSRIIDTKRFQLGPPDGGLQASEEEWQEAVHNAAMQLMHQEARLRNVELLKRYGANSWRLHNFQQEHFVSQYESHVEELTKQIGSINRKRKQDQTAAGERLTMLERKWAELVSRGLQLEVANIAAAHEIEMLEAQEQKLRAEIASMV